MTISSPLSFDVVIIGGGAAGLSAAVALGRARRSVVVLDGGEPRNAPASGVHNYLSQDGIRPSEMLRLGRAEAERYGARLRDSAAVSASKVKDGFTVTTAAGDTFTGRRLLIATGLVDELPDVPGVRERWGKSVLHCPYCHGWEVRDRAIGVLATSPKSVHQALMFRQWSENITLFLHGAPRPSDEETEQLLARGITLVEGRVESLEGPGDQLTSVRLEDGSTHQVDALVVAPVFTARTDLPAQLGVRLAPHPMGMGMQIETDAMGATSVPGVWAAGNVADLAGQVVTSADEGLRAVVSLNVDLVAEDTRDAVLAHRAAQAAAPVK
ncbi:NAD(P)/FAD-dependent oxidoreductase [Mycetocola zhujimingii]|uniref:NAD(P)/FAD-dependent oxidoreductase n=1 Tax=Mycetocola zhujimingii TaxID=2079792 RepID=UPI000D3630A2|nr:NAD(P)/FAD-dependent oxidoreductase [Mycetocola zhujimingii]AWB88094.1 thioredoxin reductase [Mycetocola zhujimingii]